MLDATPYDLQPPAITSAPAMQQAYPLGMAATKSTLFFFSSPTRAQQPGPVPFPSEISAVRITSKRGEPIPYTPSKMRDFDCDDLGFLHDGKTWAENGRMIVVPNDDNVALLAFTIEAVARRRPSRTRPLSYHRRWPCIRAHPHARVL